MNTNNVKSSSSTAPPPGMMPSPLMPNPNSALYAPVGTDGKVKSPPLSPVFENERMDGNEGPRKRGLTKGSEGSLQDADDFEEVDDEDFEDFS